MGGEIDLVSPGFFDNFQAIIEDRERGEPEEIHLQQADFFQIVHAVLRGDFLFIALVKWGDLRERLGRDDHARGVS